MHTHTHQHKNLQHLLLCAQFAGDLVFCYAGLTVGYLLRFKTPLSQLGLEVLTSFEIYQPLIWVGTVFLSASFFFLNIYDAKFLLRPQRAASMIARAFSFWFVAYLGISLVLKFEPAISRLFVALSLLSTATAILVWRYIFYRIVANSGFRLLLKQRVLIVGWTEDAARLTQAIETDDNEPYVVAGIIKTANNNQSNRVAGHHIIGDLEDSEAIVQKTKPHILVVADVDLTRDQLLRLYQIAERHYAKFTIIPSFFQIFVANLKMQTLSGEPVLGHDEPRLNLLLNRLTKRIVDIVGAIVGLIGSVPIILITAIIIKREDPGPVFFTQERVGQNGRPFLMIKLRSMKLGSDKLDHINQSTQREDPRLLKIGKSIRRLNLDELPQFWNVFRGEMSLVGPRPERTYHANRLAIEVPNYSARHLVKPGLTGWAQVNGFRGDTDLVQRVKFDLYYIENWSTFFDVQIMLMTLFRRENAY